MVIVGTAKRAGKTNSWVGLRVVGWDRLGWVGLRMGGGEIDGAAALARFVRDESFVDGEGRAVAPGGGNVPTCSGSGSAG